MAKKHHSPELIIYLLRQAEVELAGGQTVPQACRKLEMSRRSGSRRASGTPTARSAGGASSRSGGRRGPGKRTAWRRSFSGSRGRGKPFRVLVTAFTHAAIENLLRRLADLQGTAPPGVPWWSSVTECSISSRR